MNGYSTSFVTLLQAKARRFKKFELFARDHWTMSSLSLFCNKNSVFLRACVSVLSELFGFDASGNSTVSGLPGVDCCRVLRGAYRTLQADLDFKLTYSRAGVSLNSLDHLFQMIESGE